MVLKPWTRWLLAGLSAFALGAWWSPAVPERVPLVASSRDQWRITPLPRRPDQTTQVAMVNGAAFWGDAGRPKEPDAPLPDARWRIAGVFGVGADRTALVQFGDPARPAQRVKVGESLPSGHRIVNIEQGRVCVLIGKKTYWLGVERRDS
jgi:hypothetical protein